MIATLIFKQVRVIILPVGAMKAQLGTARSEEKGLDMATTEVDSIVKESPKKVASKSLKNTEVSNNTVDLVRDEQSETKSSKSKPDTKTQHVVSGVDIKQLLEAGAHFGHKTSRWHPGMKQYIHSARGGTHIIDLTKTVEALSIALDFVEQVSATGKQVLLVGTKRQAKDIIKKTAIDTGMPYVTERWLGGLLTNTKTISGRVTYLKNQEAKMESGELANRYNKLEVQRFQEEIDHMNVLYGGIKSMVGMPAAVFITDVIKEQNAVREARKLSIPIVAIIDSNADPSLADYPIPANDDAIKTIELITEYIKSAILSGKAAHTKKADNDQAKSDIKPDNDSEKSK